MLQNNCFKLLLQYTWSGIITLIKLIPQSITMRVTPPLRTAFRPILAIRTAYRNYLASRTAYRLTTKITILAFHFHKEVWMKLCYAHMHNHSCKRYIWCVLTGDFLVFEIPELMFTFKLNKLWNDPKKRERS